MMVVVRSIDYRELLKTLRDRKVAIWSCGTCARICGISGEGPVSSLAERLKADGVEVVASSSVGASCLADRIKAKVDLETLRKADLVLTLTCDAGSDTLSEVLGPVEVFNPIITLGQGRRSADGSIRIHRPFCAGIEPGDSLEDACNSLQVNKGPFVL